MKKTLAIALALVMTLSMGSVAFATPDATATSDGSITFTIDNDLPDGPYDPDPENPDGPDTPDPKPEDLDPEDEIKWNALGSMGLEFGTVELSYSDKTYKTSEAGTSNEDTSSANYAGVVVVASRPAWRVDVSISDFKDEDEEVCLEGFKLTLDLVSGSDVEYAAAGSTGTFQTATIDAGGDTATIASGTNPTDILKASRFGANFDGVLDVLGSSAQPEGLAQAVLTWDYISA